MYLYDSLGRRVTAGSIDFVNEVMRVREAKNAPWPAIDLFVKFFKKQHPKRYQSHLIEIRDIRETRKDQKFASTKDKVTGGILRYTLDIPTDIIYMIRKIYNTNELDFNREFYMEFAKRYPEWKIAEKL